MHSTTADGPTETANRNHLPQTERQITRETDFHNQIPQPASESESDDDRRSGSCYCCTTTTPRLTYPSLHLPPFHFLVLATSPCLDRLLMHFSLVGRDTVSKPESVRIPGRYARPCSDLLRSPALFDVARSSMSSPFISRHRTLHAKYDPQPTLDLRSIPSSKKHADLRVVMIDPRCFRM